LQHPTEREETSAKNITLLQQITLIERETEREEVMEAILKL